MRSGRFYRSTARDKRNGSLVPLLTADRLSLTMSCRDRRFEERGLAVSISFLSSASESETRTSSSLRKFPRDSVTGNQGTASKAFEKRIVLGHGDFGDRTGSIIEGHHNAIVNRLSDFLGDVHRYRDHL
jgi:hypothetical protein